MRKQPFKDFISGTGSKIEKERTVYRETYEDALKRHQSFNFSPERNKEKTFFSATSTKVVVFSSIILLGVFIWLSSVYSSVVVKVTTISEKIILEDTFVAVSTKDAVKDGVVFKTMKIEESETLPIIATDTKTVSEKASGEIIVYNNYSEAPQKLVAGTRFESPEGKIYKIDKMVSVPGRKIVSGKSVPGSLTVTVYAAEAGKEYNIKPTDFTLPGLKDSPRYKSVYGRSKGDISGGFVGPMKIVSPQNVALTKKKLEDSLRKKLEEKAKQQVPLGYVTYDDATFLSFEDNSREIGSEWDGDKVFLKMKGVSESFIFNEKELAEVITKKKLPTLNNYEVHSNDLPGLGFKILAREGVDPESSKMFSFKLTGNAKMIWEINIDSFKKDLLGIEKDTYQEIFKKYPTIEKAETIFSPSWSRAFPDDVNKIEVELIED